MLREASTPRTVSQALRWNGGASLPWQIAAAMVAWAYVVALHWRNDGLWYQGDSSRHAANGLFWWDFLTNLPVNPLDFALSYYVRYPVINPTAWPPAFYVLEGAAYRVFGASPLVAKSLVLLFMLMGTFYLIASLRRWVGQLAGWAGILFALQPAIVVWSHAVMLNVPAVVLSVAALYHWRRWLEDPPSRHLYAAAAYGLAAVLTYLPVVASGLVMLCWAVWQGRARELLRRRPLITAGVVLLPVAAWALVAVRWASQGAVAFSEGDHPPWQLTAWTYYLERLPQLMTMPLLLAALASMAVAVWARQWRKEVGFALIWLAVSYAWFSAISLKEPRYALLLVPPFVSLGAVGMMGSLEWLQRVGGPAAARLATPVLGAMVLLHVFLAGSTHVPSVTGFRDIVAFLRTAGESERVFYEGKYSGVFTFYLRAGDDRFDRAVVLGSKLLYVTRMSPEYGLIERVSSPEDVIDQFRGGCGCRFLVVERQIEKKMIGTQVSHTLRHTLTRDDFRLVRSFGIGTDDVRDVDVYEYLGPISSPSSIELVLPFVRDGLKFDVKPIER